MNDVKNAISQIESVTELLELNHFLVDQIKMRRSIAAAASASKLTVGGQARLNLPNHRLGGSVVTVTKINRTRAHIRIPGESGQRTVSMAALVAL